MVMRVNMDGKTDMFRELFKRATNLQTMKNSTSRSAPVRCKPIVLRWLNAMRKHPSEQPSKVLERLAAQEAIVRRNSIGGFEIVMPDGKAIGNYPTAIDAATVALRNGYKVREIPDQTHQSNHE
jgi:hypothetical protein